SAQIREILISESAWEEMTCLFAPSLILRQGNKSVPDLQRHHGRKMKLSISATSATVRLTFARGRFT
ncbi:hypothetical protein OSL35_15185, partial [Escherichia coli]|nr:hypothetical protein [Escherichia coli]